MPGKRQLRGQISQDQHDSQDQRGRKIFVRRFVPAYDPSLCQQGRTDAQQEKKNVELSDKTESF